MSKKIYAVQPYQVGPKHNKSLAVIIPSKLAKEYGVDTSTIFATCVENDNTISLHMIRAAHNTSAASTSEINTMSLKKVIDHNKFQEYECASKGCNKKGRHHLRVLFLNKEGYFCDSCRISLLEDNLVEEPKGDIYG